MFALGRKPAPEGPAPQPRPPRWTSANGTTQTLNRLEFSRRKQSRHERERQHEAPLYQNSLTSSCNKNRDNFINNRGPIYSGSPIEDTSMKNHIYAPTNNPIQANELNNQQPPTPTTILNDYNLTSQEQSQHYASSLCRRPPSAQSGSLSSLFGSLRRRSRRGWSSLTRSNNKRPNNKSQPYSNESPNVNNNNSFIFSTFNKTKSNHSTKNDKQELDAEQIYAEGLRAIDSNQLSRSLQLDLGSLEPGQSRIVVLNQEQADYKQLVGVLCNWINDLLARQRIIVRSLEEDLNDGQIIYKLVESLHNVKLDLIEVTQNEELQKQRLRVALALINKSLIQNAPWAQIKWSVDGIHSKNLAEIIHLLVFLAIYHRAPIRLPANVFIEVSEYFKHISRQTGQPVIKHRSHQIQLTTTYETSLDSPDHDHEHHHRVGLPLNKANNNDSNNNINANANRDSFDELVERAEPQKLALVMRSLVRFANRHLNKLNLTCLPMKTKCLHGSMPNHYHNGHLELDPEQFSDGLLLVFLIASLEDYFVPLGNLFTTNVLSTNPSTDNITNKHKLKLIDMNNNDIHMNIDNNCKSAIQEDSYTNTHPMGKLHNVNFALQLMEDAGIEHVRQIVRPEEIVNGNLKSVLRILYLLFSRYKHL